MESWIEKCFNHALAMIHGNGERILLVDDDVELCHSHGELLNELGYHTVVAHDGIQAVKKYEQYNDSTGIDLVLIDVVMPVLGGVKAARRILSLDPQAKIVFMMGYDRMQELGEGMLPSENKVLYKPLHISDLCVEIRQQLG